MYELRSLENISHAILYTAWQKAFATYPASWSEDQLKKMLVRRGYDASLSFGAFENGELASFTLNGIGRWNGKRTAYDTGTGTIPDFRGKGLAGKIFKFALPHLRKAGITQYLLEVLQNNETAFKIYSELGFRVTREFNYYVADSNYSAPKDSKLPTGLSFRPIANDTDDMINDMNDLQPSWQNSPDSIKRSETTFTKMGVWDDQTMVAAGIIEPSSGDIPLLVVKESHRRNKIGSALLAELLKLNQNPTFKIVNIDNSFAPAVLFLENLGIDLTGKQFEMLLDLEL